MSFAITTKRCAVSSFTVLRVTGEDATEFLQGQFSQEILPAELRKARYGFWLSRKGRVEGDATIVRLADDDCLVFSLSLTATSLIERFEAYLVADDVELVDESSLWKGWYLSGPEIGDWIGGRGGDGKDSEFAWTILPGGDVNRVLLVGQIVPDWPSGWLEVSADVMEKDRILGGIPKIPDDVGPDDMPQEAGLDRVGVSFRKGCYLGQEVMARIQSTGRIRRRLVKVRGLGNLPGEAGTLGLWQDGKLVGSLRSRIAVENANWEGLAMMNLSSTDFDLPAALAVDGEANISLQSPNDENERADKGE
jgi:folate-binding protein YgfZ